MTGQPDAPTTNLKETEPVTVVVDCRSEEGVTAGLIDSIIAIARVAARRDLKHFAVVDALHDLRGDEDVRVLLADPVSAPVSTEDADLRDQIAQRAYAAWMSAYEDVHAGDYPRTQGNGPSVWVCAAQAAHDYVRPLLEAEKAKRTSLSVALAKDNDILRAEVERLKAAQPVYVERDGEMVHPLAAELFDRNAEIDRLRGVASQEQWCVWYGGEHPDDAAGREIWDGQAEAEEALPRYRSDQGSGVAVRTLTIGPWRVVEQTPAAPVSSVEPEQDEFEGLCGAHYPPEPGTRCDRPPHHPKESHADGGFYWLDAQFPPAVPEQAQPRTWRDKFGQRWRDAEPDHLVMTHDESGTELAEWEPLRRSKVEHQNGPLTEVVEAPAGQDEQR